MGKLDKYLAERDRNDETLQRWGAASKFPESVFPEVAIRSPGDFPLENGQKLDFRRVDGFRRYQPIPFLIGVHRKLINEQFPVLSEGHHDENGHFYEHIDDDPRIQFSALADPRYKLDSERISLIRVNNILAAHYPGVTLVPSKTGYELGKVTAELADEVFSEKGSARIYEMGVGAGIIMASALKHYQGDNIHYIGGDIDGNCLTVCDLTMQLNGFDRNNLSLSKGDGLDPIRGTKVDIIVSNPPYYPTKDAAATPERGPSLAMNGGEDGLDFYRLLLNEGPNFLLPNGKILVQVSNVNLQQVRDLAERRFGKHAKVSVIRQSGRRVEQKTPRGKGVLIELI
ncbi:MAG: class I SAM-dependent methyltransferase [Candidatus Gracilibacteria bacterium]